MPDALVQALIIERDGFHCRFCGIPVIRAQVRRAMHSAYPNALPWGRTNATQHAAFQCMWLQFDHVLPNTRGGRSDLENLIVTCAPCNFGRMEWTIAEIGLLDPRGRVLLDHWSGYRRWRGLEEFLDSTKSSRRD
jgi:5-methylcytosine-specific restriction endonuclease McrA